MEFFYDFYSNFIVYNFSNLFLPKKANIFLGSQCSYASAGFLTIIIKKGPRHLEIQKKIGAQKQEDLVVRRWKNIIEKFLFSHVMYEARWVTTSEGGERHE